MVYRFIDIIWFDFNAEFSYIYIYFTNNTIINTYSGEWFMWLDSVLEIQFNISTKGFLLKQEVFNIA